MIIASKVNNRIVDLHDGCANTEKGIERNSEEGEQVLRHSAAHILGEVIYNNYQNVSFAIGPVTTYGFYYDVLMNDTISFYDLPKLEAQMKSIVRQSQPFNKSYIRKEEAINRFSKDVCKQLILKNIPHEKVSLYTQNNFIDLCEGPHVLNTNDVGEHFKLTHVSQVNWKGLLLQRVEGVLFHSKERLDTYLSNLEKQISVDHRKIGEECGLFCQIAVTQGNMFWLENGNKLFRTIYNYLESKYKKYNYKLVQTPLIFKEDLWKKTGHSTKYGDNMYFTKERNVIKPMNCPGHVEIFKTINASYRDLPLRIGEIGHVHRKEETGALNGLKRACGFRQDDGHIFCAQKDVYNEIKLFMKMVNEIYTDFGFSTYDIVVSTRPEQRIGDDEKWNISESTIINWLEHNKKKYTIAVGDGAFYGPKIEIQLQDNFMRKWTCGTLQWDDFLPAKLNAFYNSSDNKKLAPIMLHRAVIGSIERFVAILLEHYEGHLPLWLAPLLVVITSVSEKTRQYSKIIHRKMMNSKLDVILDISDNPLGSKLKKYLIQKIPFVLIVGEKELEQNNISVRYKNKNYTMQLKDFTRILKNAIKKKMTAINLHE